MKVLIEILPWGKVYDTFISKTISVWIIPSKCKWSLLHLHHKNMFESGRIMNGWKNVSKQVTLEMNRMSRCNYPDSWWMTPSTCVTKSACIMIATMMVIRHLSFADLPTLSESHNRGIATCFSSFRTSQTQLCGSGVCSDALSVVLPTVSFGVSQALNSTVSCQMQSLGLRLHWNPWFPAARSAPARRTRPLLPSQNAGTQIQNEYENSLSSMNVTNKTTMQFCNADAETEEG